METKHQAHYVEEGSPFCDGCTRECPTKGCEEWARYYQKNWNSRIHRLIRREPPTQVTFRYEHPDLIREGIIWGEQEGTAELADKREVIHTMPQKAAAAPEKPHSPAYPPRKCGICNREFTPATFHQKYCCSGCAEQGNREKAKARYAQKAPETDRFCAVCGALIPKGTHLGAKVCSEICRTERNRAQKQAKNARYRARKKAQADG